MSAAAAVPEMEDGPLRFACKYIYAAIFLDREI